MKKKTMFQARTMGLLVIALFAVVLFSSGCGSEGQEVNSFLSRPLTEVTLGELLFCVCLVCLFTR